MAAPQDRPGKDIIDDLVRRVNKLEQRERARMTRRPHLPLIDMSTQGTPWPQDGAIVIDYRGLPTDAVAQSTVKYGYGGQWRAISATSFEIKLFGDSDSIEVVSPRFTFMIPERMDDFLLSRVYAFVPTVSSSGPVAVQVRNATQILTMLSTALTIDASEYTSKTAGTPAVINSTNRVVSGGDLVAIDVTAAGTGAQGLGVLLEFAAG